MSEYVWFPLGLVIGYTLPFIKLKYGQFRCDECDRKYYPKKSISRYPYVYCSAACELVSFHKQFVKAGISDEQASEYLSKKYIK